MGDGIGHVAVTGVALGLRMWARRHAVGSVVKVNVDPY